MHKLRGIIWNVLFFDWQRRLIIWRLLPRKGGLSLICSIMVIVAFAPFAAAQQQKEIAHVLDLEGEWILNAQVRLSKGQRLPAGGVIRARSPKPTYRIFITDLHGKKLLSKNCDPVSACSRAVSLPKQLSSRSSPLATIYNAAIELIWGSGNTYSTHRRRGGLSDGVALLKDRQLDLSSVFGGKFKDKYHLVFRTVPKKDDSDKRMRSALFAFDWDPANPSPLSVPAMKPGLVEIALSENGEEFWPTGDMAWVLVVPPEEYEKAAASFQHARELTKDWDDDLGLETIDSFLRASLHHLALQMSTR